MVSLDDEGNDVAEGDILGQTREAHAHVREALERLDAGMDDVVEETLYVTDIGLGWFEIKVHRPRLI